jgi:predicted RNase H-like nuclease (RuvC/YqgF family)
MKIEKIAWGIIICAVAVIMINVYPQSRSHMSGQDLNSLDRRISFLEQRFNNLESNIYRLQQQVVLSQGSSGSQTRVRDQEINRLLEEIQRLSLRVNEIECGLLKLDERTAVAGRNNRNDAAKSGDPCRANPATPLRLSSRP